MRQPIVKNGLVIRHVKATIRTGYEGFISAPNRKHSPEIDYGSNWVEVDNPDNFPLWRVSWIQNTGELYAVELVNTLPGLRRFIVIGVFQKREEVDALMDGWSEVPFRLGPLCNIMYKHLHTIQDTEQ